MTTGKQQGFTSAAASKRAHRRDQVANQLEAATRALLADGNTFGDLTVEKLAAAAGISRSTFYLYFPDKADLIRALTEPTVDQLTATVVEWARIDQRITRPQLCEVLGALTQAYQHSAMLIGALIDMTARDTAIHEYVDDLMSRVIGALGEHITRAQTRGEIETQLPAVETASWLLWMIERGHRQLSLVNETPIDKITGSLVDVVWHTLYAHPG